MAERRTIEDVRAEIAVEREKLSSDTAALQRDARAALPFAVGGLAALLLVAKRRTLRRAFALLWFLR